MNKCMNFANLSGYLPPLVQSEILATMASEGKTLRELAYLAGLARSTVSRRLALTGLCRAGRSALRAGRVSLALAEALAECPLQLQHSLILDIGVGRRLSAADVRAVLKERTDAGPAPR